MNFNQVKKPEIGASQSLQNLQMLNKIFTKKQIDHKKYFQPKESKSQQQIQSKVKKHDKINYKYLNNCALHPQKKVIFLLKAKYFLVYNKQKNFCSICAEQQNYSSEIQEPNKTQEVVKAQEPVRTKSSKYNLIRVQEKKLKIHGFLQNTNHILNQIQSLMTNLESSFIQPEMLTKKLDYRVNLFIQNIQKSKQQTLEQVNEIATQYNESKQNSIKKLQEYEQQIKNCNLDFTQNYEGIISNIEKNAFETILKNYQQQIQNILQFIQQTKNEEKKLLNLNQDKEQMYDNFKTFMECFHQVEENFNKKINQFMPGSNEEIIFQEILNTPKLKNAKSSEKLQTIQKQQVETNEKSQSIQKQQTDTNDFLIKEKEQPVQKLQINMNKSQNINYKIQKPMNPPQPNKLDQKLMSIKNQNMPLKSTKLNHFLNIMTKVPRSPTQKSEKSLDKSMLHKLLSANKAL